MDTYCFDSFCFLPFFESLYSLFKRARGIYLMIPFLNGEVTGVTCVPESCVDVFVCVWECESVEGVALAPLVLSGKLPWSFFFFSLMPHCEDKHSYNYTCFSFPCWQLSLLFVSTSRGKDRTFDVNVPQVLYSLKYHLKVKELSFLPPCWEHLCALLFCLTGPPLIWTKRHEEAPWRFSVGMTSLQNTSYTLGNSRGVARYALKGPAVLTRSSACNIFTSFFLYWPKWVACDFWGQKSFKKMHWFKLIWIVLSDHYCHVKAVHHFYNLC